MSISIFITAIKPADEYHFKMMKIFELCNESNVTPPKDVLDYFEDETPNPLGVQINHYDLPEECRTEFSRDHESGYRIDLTKLPKDVQYLEVKLS